MVRPASCVPALPENPIRSKQALHGGGVAMVRPPAVQQGSLFSEVPLCQPRAQKRDCTEEEL